MAWFSVNFLALILATFVDLAIQYVWFQQFPDRTSRAFVQKFQSHKAAYVFMTLVKVYCLGLIVNLLPNITFYNAFWLCLVVWLILNISGKLKVGFEQTRKPVTNRYLLDLIEILSIGFIFVIFV